MATATVNLPKANRGVSSEATLLGPEGTGEIDYIICPIPLGTAISLDKSEPSVVVIRPFVIELTPTEEGYMASSRISNTFELGSTLNQAARNYLDFLADEILWLQKNAKQLSPSLQDGFRLLQHYLRIE